MIIKRDFYNRKTLQVSQNLLGCFLIRRFKNKIYRVIITETEAYRGFYDLASHASRGKTERNKIMFGCPGHVYIYLVYGMHWMLNIVTEKKGFPAAVLIRGAIIEGGRRLNGPGKLTKFLKINKSLNGIDVTKSNKLWVEKKRVSCQKCKIIKSPRIGVDYAKHCKHWKWNFKLTKV